MAKKITDYQDIIDDRADRLVRDQRRRIAAAVTATDPGLAADLIDEAICQGERLSRSPDRPGRRRAAADPTGGGG